MSTGEPAQEPAFPPVQLDPVDCSGLFCCESLCQKTWILVRIRAVIKDPEWWLIGVHSFCIQLHCHRCINRKRNLKFFYFCMGYQYKTSTDWLACPLLEDQPRPLQRPLEQGKGSGLHWQCRSCRNLEGRRERAGREGVSLMCVC